MAKSTKSNQVKIDKSFEKKVFNFYKEHSIQFDNDGHLTDHTQTSKNNTPYYGVSLISGTTNPNILI